MVGAAAFRGVTGHIQEVAFLVALGAGIGGLHGGDEESAFAAFPVGLVA